jgi:hypothetical protein
MKLKPVVDGSGQLRGYSFYTSGDVVWSFDGNLDQPTFTPSLLNKCDNHPNPKRRVCHLNLTAGKLQFHPDCTHYLAGKLIELKDNADRSPVNGICCTCGFSGEEEALCPSWADGTHCRHWYNGPDGDSLRPER